MKLSSLVFLVLLFLKLAGIGVVATWSWWLVTLPLWYGVAIGLCMVGAGLGLAFVATGVGGIFVALRHGLKAKRK